MSAERALVAIIGVAVAFVTLLFVGLVLVQLRT